MFDEPMHAVDWYPTLLKAAGAPLDQNLPLDGLDVWPVLTQGGIEDLDIVCHDTLSEVLGRDRSPFEGPTATSEGTKCQRGVRECKCLLFKGAPDEIVDRLPELLHSEPRAVPDDPFLSNSIFWKVMP
jgi:hypothetical protein